jgi:hypothetical protein
MRSSYLAFVAVVLDTSSAVPIVGGWNEEKMCKDVQYLADCYSFMNSFDFSDAPTQENLDKVY